MLKASGLSFAIAGCPLLVKVDVTLAPGTVTAVVGPNGSGKTSLLKLLSGELAPTAGAVTLQHKDLSKWSARERAQLIAVLPQHSGLHFPFTVEDVIALGRYPHSSGQQRDHEIVEQVIAQVDAEHLRQRSYMTLSGGEKQRVHLARVLAQVWEASELGARYLLLDEPTSALDLAHQHLALATAQHMAMQGVGVLVILHDLNLAAQYADQVLLLKAGQTVAQGDSYSVFTVDNIRQVFEVDVQLMAHPQTGKPMVIHA